VLENALILSTSSYGLQPWKFIVITDQKMRETFFSDVEPKADSRLLAFYRLRRERDDGSRNISIGTLRARLRFAVEQLRR
jgi:nitroreductase